MGHTRYSGNVSFFSMNRLGTTRTKRTFATFSLSFTRSLSPICTCRSRSQRPTADQQIFRCFSMPLTAALSSSSSYAFTTSATVLLYDLLLLLPTEIDYVWLPRPLHPHLLLFALNCYLPLIDMVVNINQLLHKPTPTQCRQFAFVAGPLMALGIFTSQVILMIRTYAIWDRHRVVFWCFIGTGIFCFIPGVVCLAIELKTLQFIELPFDHLNCLSISPTYG
ncbi:uncharacterized protein EV420DRAFT_978433 [Desarmillaria tabescens]|uniref:DUF6533 domain-containing protein n=1 Tax=Armillaria tabescens TaxID=1929756 RepID=A0AA39JM00_ARMTA|nr:uncharacterized protein EV420DRAFT_978433 [Desarmillaria tabescens]KAK0444974.1 hypothetical protein EV420DRAFT_978433 [Desarmillaria tabescens]